jgi:hypothetical protein
MSAITHLFAGVTVSDRDAGIDWYTRFSGHAADSRVGEEILWEVDEHAWLFIEPNPARAGAGRITFAVTGLDAVLERSAAERIEHEPVETYSNGVRHVKSRIQMATPSRSPSRPTARARPRDPPSPVPVACLEALVEQRRQLDGDARACGAHLEARRQRHADRDDRESWGFARRPTRVG